MLITLTTKFFLELQATLKLVQPPPASPNLDFVHVLPYYYLYHLHNIMTKKIQNFTTAATQIRFKSMINKFVWTFWS